MAEKCPDCGRLGIDDCNRDACKWDQWHDGTKVTTQQRQHGAAFANKMNDYIAKRRQKHTPAPWSVSNGQWVVAFRDGNKGEIVAAPTYWMEHAKEESSANARLIAAAPAMYDLIAMFGDAVTDMFEQMLRGRWTDDQGHDVRLNAQMAALKPLIVKAIELRAAISKAEAA